MIGRLAEVSRFGMEAAPGDSRLGEAMIYVARRLENDGGGRGSVKLNKVLWWADFESFRVRGRSVTGAEYQKLPEGPAPVRLLPARERLIADGAVEVVERDVGAPNPERMIRALRAPASVFDDEDTGFMDAALVRFNGLSGTECSELSHSMSVGWRSVEEQQSIPYETALLSSQRPTAEQLATARDVAVAAGLVAE